MTARNPQSLRQPNHWVREARFIYSASDRAGGLYQCGNPTGKVCIINRRDIVADMAKSGNCETLPTAAFIGCIRVFKFKSSV